MPITDSTIDDAAWAMAAAEAERRWRAELDHAERQLEDATSAVTWAVMNGEHEAARNAGTWVSHWRSEVARITAEMPR